MSAADDAMMRGSIELFEAMDLLCAGRPAADVMYAIGMMIAKGVEDNAATADLDRTFSLLRQAAELELAMSRDAVEQPSPPQGENK
jgi:hypothetical protein